MQLTAKIYYYPWQGQGNNCNTYLFASEKNVLFDPGHIRNEFNENCIGALERAIKTDGFDLEMIDLILCTHGHPDHCEAAAIIKNKSNAYLAIHRQDEPFLEKIFQRYSSSKAETQITSVQPDFYLKEGHLELGRASRDQIKVLHTPGHSPGSVSFYLPGEKALITGDTVFRGSIGRTDLPGGDIDTLANSVKKLLTLEEVDLLLPGHMNIIQGQDKIKHNFMLIWNFFFAGK